MWTPLPASRSGEVPDSDVLAHQAALATMSSSGLDQLCAAACETGERGVSASPRGACRLGVPQLPDGRMDGSWAAASCATGPRCGSRRAKVGRLFAPGRTPLRIGASAARPSSPPRAGPSARGPSAEIRVLEIDAFSSVHDLIHTAIKANGGLASLKEVGHSRASKCCRRRPAAARASVLPRVPPGWRRPLAPSGAASLAVPS